MQIILVRIPPDTTLYDITQFLEPVLKKGFFVRKGVIENIEIKIIHDANANVTEYHGLVRIEPDAAAKRAVNKLNRKAINGKHIAVREYHTRNWHNDLRLATNPVNLKFLDRRKVDRRRPHVQVQSHDVVHFSSNKSFHRTF